MQHLLSIDDLSVSQFMALITSANQLKKTPLKQPITGRIASTLFYENSTRTHMSFQIAAHHLGIALFPLAVQQSSTKKGETLLDTVLSLHAMNVRLMIIRHSVSGILESLRMAVPSDLHLINAGDGQHEHPTQALLDWMTILEHYPDPSALKIAIVGDIRHSRVAHSFQKACRLLGVSHVVSIAPALWQPDQVVLGTHTEDLAAGLQDADVIVTLRVQQERLQPDEQYCLQTYHERYGITAQTMAHAKPSAIVLHPGPINRGIEISDEIADGPASCILQQVQNGVWMRMAVMRLILSDGGLD